MALSHRIPKFLDVLRQSQRWPADRLQNYQNDLLARLVRHAHETVPFYADRLAPLFRRKWGPRLHKWDEVPVLTRSQVMENHVALISAAVPRDHGAISSVVTSGSTGEPVSVNVTQLAHTAMLACVALEHELHGHDRDKSIAFIRFNQKNYPDGAKFANWGPETAVLGFTGPAYALNLTTDIADQVEWLGRIRPAYLNSYPSNLAAIAEYLIANPKHKFALHGLSTVGEMLVEDQQELFQRVWGCRAVTNYSATETGCLALQCPEFGVYHICSEVAHVEILDADNRPCPPGVAGRVVATPLYNYATPLIRFEVGDYAIPGPPCKCGRTAPVLREILGRTRNMFHYADGTTNWPAFSVAKIRAVFPVQQFQVIQERPDLAVVRYVAPRDPNPREVEHLVAAFIGELHPDLEIRLERVENIARHSSGKFEQALCKFDPTEVILTQPQG
ncbi:MAG: phenylacetate--CoA ligase family protein [Alphaproteobacteria bacterium]